MSHVAFDESFEEGNEAAPDLGVEEFAVGFGHFLPSAVEVKEVQTAFEAVQAVTGFEVSAWISHLIILSENDWRVIHKFSKFLAVQI